MGQGGGDALDPILAYNAGEEVNQLQWCSGQYNWAGTCFGNKTRILLV